MKVKVLFWQSNKIIGRQLVDEQEILDLLLERYKEQYSNYIKVDDEITAEIEGVIIE